MIPTAMPTAATAASTAVAILRRRWLGRPPRTPPASEALAVRDDESGISRTMALAPVRQEAVAHIVGGQEGGAREIHVRREVEARRQVGPKDRVGEVDYAVRAHALGVSQEMVQVLSQHLPGRGSRAEVLLAGALRGLKRRRADLTAMTIASGLTSTAKPPPLCPGPPTGRPLQGLCHAPAAQPVMMAWLPLLCTS